MQTSNDTLGLLPSSYSLLHATGVPQTLEGAARTPGPLTTCIRQAEKAWPDTDFSSWLASANAIHGAIGRLADTSPENASVCYQTPQKASIAFVEISKWQSGALNPRLQHLDAALGRACVVFAQAKSVVPDKFMTGLRSLRNAVEGRGARSPDWTVVARTQILDITAVKNLKSSIGPNSPCIGFIETLLTVLSTGVLHADLVARPAAIKADDAVEEGTGLSKSARHRDHDHAEPDGGEDTSDDDDRVDMDTTRIAARLATADYTPAVAKLGIPFRDHLLIEDLARVTAALVDNINSLYKHVQGFAVLGLVSFVTATSDSFALSITLEPRAGHLWLDLAKGAWCWDFNAYRSKKAVAEQHANCSPVVIPIPSVLAQVLGKLQPPAGGFKTVNDLICYIQGVETVDVKTFREYLRSIGDKAHPPYRGRLANSLASAILEVTGSDMLCALLTAQFAACAPAALYYFGPSYKTIYSSLNAVYTRLGLGQCTTPMPENIRAGGHHIPEANILRQGWQDLVQKINDSRTKTFKAANNAQLLQEANNWMVQLCAAFIVQSAHRGSRLDQLTFGALASSDRFMVVHDKNVDDLIERSQPRLLPKTGLIRVIVDSALECHDIVATMGGQQTTLHFESDSPVFASFESCGSTKRNPVVVSDVAIAIRESFGGAPINFARSTWITELDACGCDRWLIRSLSGHVRDVTRTSGPFFDIPIATVASRLGASMEAQAAILFGQEIPAHAKKGTPRPPLPPSPHPMMEARSIRLVPAPANILSPVDADVLMGAELATSALRCLLEGTMGSNAAPLLLLNLLFVDQVPDPQVAFAAVMHPGESFDLRGPRPALKWSRAHFVHPVWLPLHAATAFLLERRGLAAMSRDELLRETTAALNLSPLAKHAALNSTSCWDSLSFWSQSFRRLHLPPSLLAASHPSVPAPCLNGASIARLTGHQYIDTSPRPPRLARNHSAQRAKSGDITALGTVLNKYGDTDQRLGERRLRAINALSAIQEITANWSPGGLWLRDWALDELRRSRDAAKNCYRVSSIATYFSTLILARRSLQHSDPADWDEEEWEGFISEVQQGCTGDIPSMKTEICDRAKPALLAVARSLSRRDEFVPATVWSRLQEAHEKLAPGDSASSILITFCDRAQALLLARDWLNEDPSTLLRVRIRLHLGAHHPMRSADFGNLKRYCLTAAGGLVIERSGFNNIKTELTVRLWKIAAEVLRQFKKLADELARYTPHGDLLLRGLGTNAEVHEDLRAADCLNAALKAATGDSRARPHSLRATALQDLAWRAWQAVAKAFLNRTLPTATATSWASDCDSDWIGVARACAAAGHSGIGSALSNYLAGWPLVHALRSYAMVSSHPVSRHYTTALGLSDAALRQARSRALRAGVTEDRFSVWDWYENQLARRLTSGHGGSPVAESECSRSTPKRSDQTESGARADVRPHVAEFTIPVAVQYMSLRCLGMKTEQAINDCKLAQTAAFMLDKFLPPEQLTASSIRRARGGPQARGENANLALVSSDPGRHLINWALGLSEEVLRFGVQVFIRETTLDSAVQHLNFWGELAKELPLGMSLQVQRGSAHMSEEEIANRHKFARVVFKAARDLGARPVVTIIPKDVNNRVLQSRVTSVARVLLLCTQYFQSNQGKSR